MSLANENDLIIPGTVGIISAAVKEANRHLDRYREHIVQDENKNKNRHYINIKLVFYNNVFEHIQTKPEAYNKRYCYVVWKRFYNTVILQKSEVWVWPGDG